MDTELPLKCSDFPSQGSFSVPWGPMFRHQGLSEEQTGTDAFMRELNKVPYGSEKPITLCEAFIRKYLVFNKSEVCMQMRRSKEDALFIIKSMHKDIVADINLDLIKEPTVMVQYTMSDFFL